MNCPPVIKLFHLDFAVCWMTEEVADSADKNGWIDFTRQRMWLNSELAPAKLAEVALHEILHGVNQFLGIEDGEKEENAVTRQARGLLVCMRDNPLFFRWLRVLAGIKA